MYGTYGNHHHVVRDGIERSVYNFGWFVDKGVLTEKHVLPLRATFLD